MEDLQNVQQNAPTDKNLDKIAEDVHFIKNVFLGLVILVGIGVFCLILSPFIAANF